MSSVSSVASSESSSDSSDSEPNTALLAARPEDILLGLDSHSPPPAPVQQEPTFEKAKRTYKKKVNSKNMRSPSPAADMENAALSSPSTLR